MLAPANKHSDGVDVVVDGQGTFAMVKTIVRVAHTTGARYANTLWTF
jgi:hypothetical protein